MAKSVWEKMFEEEVDKNVRLRAQLGEREAEVERLTSQMNASGAAERRGSVRTLEALGETSPTDPEHHWIPPWTLATRLRNALAQLGEVRKVLELISVVDHGCGGTLTFEEMANSAMRRARAALKPAQGADSAATEGE